jgi:hypothetical protein
MSLLVATQVTAVATAILAVGAILTAVFAILAFRKQSQEVTDQAEELSLERQQLKDQQEINRLQAEELQASLDERKREAATRRREQASRVFTWEVRAAETRAQMAEGKVWKITLNVTNSSDQPVYDVTVRWHKGTAPWDEPDHLPQLMPGEKSAFARKLPPDLPASVDRALYGAVLMFRDAAGVTWFRHPDGRLVEASPQEDLGL